MKVDFLVIGGGIVGASTAWQITRSFPGSTVAIVEKESALAGHQTGHNSGVIHAGVYYAPGSLKTQLCKQGAEETSRFCQEHGVPYEQRGKLVVATTPGELERLNSLFDRCHSNGLEIERLDAGELRFREPNVIGLGAMYVRATGIADYMGITRAMADIVTQCGGRIHLSTKVLDIRETTDCVHVVTDQGDIEASYVIACSGLMADRIARMCGIDVDFRIIPFKGMYYRLAESRERVVHHLIYPVPDPALPFLGVHLTPTIQGSITVGPNAVLSWAREGYGQFDFNVRDLWEMFSFGGFWKVVAEHLDSGVAEFRSSLSKARFIKLCQKYCPGLRAENLIPHPSGIRAQAVMRDGTLAHDFIIRNTERTLHVCNAPSPAATSAIPIARHIVSRIPSAMASPRRKLFASAT